MDLLPLGFLVLICMVGGAIAYAADHLGKKLGKKRLSLFGLRPRHTAALGTVLLGFAVSLLTILLVAFASSDVRDWIVMGQRAIDENRHLVVDVKQKQQQLEAQRGELAQFETRNRTLLGQLRSGDERLKEQRKTLVTQKAAIDDLAARRSALEAQLGQSRRQIVTQQRLIAAAKTRLDTVTASLEHNRTEYRVVSADLQKTQTNLRSTNQKLNESRREALRTDQANQQLQRSIDEQKQLLAQLDGQKRELEVARSRAEDDLKKSETDLADSRRRVDEARTQLNEVTATLNAVTGLAKYQGAVISSAVAPSRFERMVYQYGEEIVRLPVPAGLGREDANNALTTLLRMARISAKERGAEGHITDGRTYEVADIYDRKDNKTGEDISAAQIKDSVVARLTGQRSNQVLIAYCSLNAFRGEPVALEIAIMRNPLVYRRSEVVAEARIDGQNTESEILEQFSKFVGERVRDKAKQDQMIPRAQAEQSFGALAPEIIFDVVQKVKAANRQVRLQALAENDTRAADPLRLEFRIR